MRAMVLAFGLFWVGACASPGLDYVARLPAGYPSAAEYREIAVGRFTGPESGWYADQFEAMLQSAEVDGTPWFYVTPARAGGQSTAGLYTGAISVDYIDEDYYEQTTRKCVEWDGPFDCETRADVLEVCVETEVEVSVYPELSDRSTGEIVFAGRYRGDASGTECRDAVDYAYGKPRGHGRPPYVGDLVREALLDTLDEIRVDVAPRNARVRAPLIAEALDPVVRADPMFAQAVEAAKGAPAYACSLWESLAGQYPAAPAVLHNQAACLEAQGDYDGAQALYAEAADKARAGGYAEAEDPFKKIYRSLERISSRRSSELWFDFADGAPPAEDAVDLEEAANTED